MFCNKDNISEMMRGVNSLGLYTISSDAFITIEHPGINFVKVL